MTANTVLNVQDKKREIKREIKTGITERAEQGQVFLFPYIEKPASGRNGVEHAKAVSLTKLADEELMRRVWFTHII